MQINMKYIEADRKGYANFSRYRRTAEYGAFTNFFLDLGLIGVDGEKEEYTNRKSRQCHADTQFLMGEYPIDSSIVSAFQPIVFQVIVKTFRQKAVPADSHPIK